MKFSFSEREHLYHDTSTGRRGSKNFSRGGEGGVFSKKIETFVDLFLGTFVFRHFLENVDQKLAFFRRAFSPPN